MQEANAELKKKLKASNTSSEKDKALFDAGMESQQERLEAMIKVKQEDYTLNMETMKGKHAKLTTVVEELEENLQREREEVEVLQMSLKEKEITCVKNMEEAHKGIIQRKCEEIEGLRMRIEEKETMDAVKAAADAAEAKGIVKCTVEEIDAWEKEYDEKESAFLRECAYFVPKLTRGAIGLEL